jgi:hypothetical protein
MSNPSWLFENVTTAPSTAAGIITDHRARLALEEKERAQKRRVELAEQRSSANPPDVRIRAWEKTHGLRLPSDPTHPILDVIAVATRLTLEDVHEEQRARLARTVGAPT